MRSLILSVLFCFIAFVPLANASSSCVNNSCNSTTANYIVNNKNLFKKSVVQQYTTINQIDDNDLRLGVYLDWPEILKWKVASFGLKTKATGIFDNAQIDEYQLLFGATIRFIGFDFTE